MHLLLRWTGAHLLTSEGMHPKIPRSEVLSYDSTLGGAIIDGGSYTAEGLNKHIVSQVVGKKSQMHTCPGGHSFQRPDNAR